MALVRSAGPTGGSVGTARLPATTMAAASLQATRSDPSLSSGPGLRLPSCRNRFGEAVTHAEHGLDVVRTDLAADVLDVRVDRALVRLDRHSSHRVEQLRSRKHPSRLARHQGHD